MKHSKFQSNLAADLIVILNGFVNVQCSINPFSHWLNFVCCHSSHKSNTCTKDRHFFFCCCLKLWKICHVFRLSLKFWIKCALTPESDQQYRIGEPNKFCVFFFFFSYEKHKFHCTKSPNPKSQNQIWNIYWILLEAVVLLLLLLVTVNVLNVRSVDTIFHLLPTTGSKFHIRDICWLLVSRFLIFIDLYDLLAGCWWCLFGSRLLI